MAAAWEKALDADRPVILEARTDPNVPPLPPHITLQQAKAFLSSLPTDAERRSVISRSAKQIFASIMPARKS